ncbi:MAG: hypothetical protein ACFNLJ_02630, partial [Selenomonas artemidis]
MPETNEGDVTKAPARRGRLYGRKWKILIYKPAYKIDENGSATDERDPEHDTEMDVSMLKSLFALETGRSTWKRMFARRCADT